MTLKEKIKQLEDKLALYEDFIITEYGQQVLDKLDRDYRIQQTNEMLEINDIYEFEQALLNNKL